jgi:serine protease Do
MKKAIFTILLGFSAGLGGSYVYQTYFTELDEPLQKGDIAISRIHHTKEDILTSAMPLPSPNPPETESIAAWMKPADFVQASKLSTQSVVYIKTVSQNNYGSTWMDWFFGNRAGQSISSGSGVIYSTDGYVITNSHVVKDADYIEVILGKRTHEAVLVGDDPSTDLAVLKIEAEDLPAIKIGNSREVETGDWVLAVGNPFNLTSTVTAGIVSAKGRQLDIMKSMFPIESFIQTDAAINPGNSGGALVNLRGELIGINTAILSKTGSYAGYGFAVPSDIVKKVVEDIITYGEVQKAFFGAEVLDINSEIAEKIGIEDYSGVVVSYVQEDGAAADIDLRKGDIILKLDNVLIDSRSQFEEILSYKSPGEKVDVVFKRKQKIISNSATLTNKEGTTELLKREVFTYKSLGADLEKVSKVERNLLNIEHGVRILEVRNGLIRQMNLGEGFIITHINKVAINDPETVADILSKIQGTVYVQGVNKRGRQEIHRYYF